MKNTPSNPLKLQLLGPYVICKICQINTDHVNKDNEYIGLCSQHDPYFDPNNREYLEEEREVDMNVRQLARIIWPYKKDEKKEEKEEEKSEYEYLEEFIAEASDVEPVTPKKTRKKKVKEVKEVIIQFPRQYTLTQEEIDEFKDKGWDDSDIQDWIEEQNFLIANDL